MAGTSEGAKKAAETRKEHDPESFEKMGEKGGQTRHEKSSGEKGGSHSQGGTGRREEK